MMEQNKKEWIGRKVFLILKSGRKYSGFVISFTDKFICIKDKFLEDVMASVDEISSLEVEG